MNKKNEKTTDLPNRKIMLSCLINNCKTAYDEYKRVTITHLKNTCILDDGSFGFYGGDLSTQVDEKWNNIIG